ncbi:RusA family crossover junction endodeoxyribonuclease [Campylobacter sp. CNRCH_2016_3089]|uniref:RusA family crossover junction endodeoxyribonuclease n=1 Tax=Campylobacter sp. CNRCH_2016_3089 TaxID=2911609 RepID=UPI0021E6CBB5|nr:RusA family crossover junction endodeoxyribonuclease [Campylobacter sp. CNRCH_2016_3089]MCV3508840.1 RusA family crossover junction endodeoxyribonuclease [Campylobacter sp. CNRCH_2016_3089]
MSYSLKLELKNNPVPYKRTTQRAKFVCKDYLKYLDFKKYLQIEFRKQNGISPNQAFDSKKQYEFSLKIGFNNKKHGDADNIVKAVLDALFENDKNVLKGKYEIVAFKKAFLDLEISQYDFKEGLSYEQ